MERTPDETEDLRAAVRALAEAVSRQADQIRVLREEVEAMQAAAAYGQDHENYGGITS